MTDVELIKRLKDKQLEVISGVHDRIKHYTNPAELVSLTDALKNAIEGLESLNRMAIATESSLLEGK